MRAGQRAREAYSSREASPRAVGALKRFCLPTVGLATRATDSAHPVPGSYLRTAEPRALRSRPRQRHPATRQERVQRCESGMVTSLSAPYGRLCGAQAREPVPCSARCVGEQSRPRQPRRMDRDSARFSVRYALWQAMHSPARRRDASHQASGEGPGHVAQRGTHDGPVDGHDRGARRRALQGSCSLTPAVSAGSPCGARARSAGRVRPRSCCASAARDTRRANCQSFGARGCATCAGRCAAHVQLLRPAAALPQHFLSDGRRYAQRGARGSASVKGGTSRRVAAPRALEKVLGMRAALRRDYAVYRRADMRMAKYK